MNELVSIIMPSYNSEAWIEEAIVSVQSQTYKNWQLIVSDDGSIDNTVKCVESMISTDSRIILLKSAENQGAAKARNRALKETKGRYIAYLDSDDVWKKSKLEHQLNYMLKTKCAMCYTSYDLINENGQYRKTIHVPQRATYDSFLKGPITFSQTIILDSNLISKDLMLMPDIRRGQDSATWLQILKTGIIGYGLDESLAMYRRHDGSLSNNKFMALKRTWHLYRKVEKLPLLYASRCFGSYAINAIKKYS